MILQSSTRISLIALACSLCALALSACSAVDKTAFLQNLQGCERHYNGIVSAKLTGPSFDGTIKVDCQPSAALRGPQTIDDVLP